MKHGLFDTHFDPNIMAQVDKNTRMRAERLPPADCSKGAHPFQQRCSTCRRYKAAKQFRKVNGAKPPFNRVDRCRTCESQGRY